MDLLIKIEIIFKRTLFVRFFCVDKFFFSFFILGYLQNEKNLRYTCNNFYYNCTFDKASTDSRDE